MQHPIICIGGGTKKNLAPSKGAVQALTLQWQRPRAVFDMQEVQDPDQDVRVCLHAMVVVVVSIDG